MDLAAVAALADSGLMKEFLSALNGDFGAGPGDAFEKVCWFFSGLRRPARAAMVFCKCAPKKNIFILFFFFSAPKTSPFLP